MTAHAESQTLAWDDCAPRLSVVSGALGATCVCAAPVYVEVEAGQILESRFFHFCFRQSCEGARGCARCVCPFRVRVLPGKLCCEEGPHPGEVE